MLVKLYVVGNYSLLILIGTVMGAIGVGYYLRSGMNKAQKAREAPEVAPAPPQPPRLPGKHDREASLSSTRTGRRPRLERRPGLASPIFTGVRGRVFSEVLVASVQLL